jgi:DNA-binding protein HU-beta
MAEKKVKTITTAEQLRKTVAAALETTQENSKKIVEAVFAAAKTTVKERGELRIDGFGTFKMISRSAHEGFNPRSNQRIQVEASRGVSFRAGKVLKELVNS